MNRYLVVGLGLVLVAVTGCAALPGGPSAGRVGTASCTGATVPGLTAEQTSNARAIAQVALSRGLGEAGVLVGIVTALTESTLVAVNYGDRNSDGTMTSSRGLFQQMDHWGPLAVRLDPAGSAGLFYDALVKLDPVWTSQPVQMQAQHVEQSQFSDGRNYAGNLPQARTVTTAVMTGCTLRQPGGTGLGGAIVAAAESQLGVRYSWGGGSLTGPTVGIRDGGRADTFGDYAAVGWDCSGLTRFAVYTATQGRVEIPRRAVDQRSAGVPVPADLARMVPGDLIIFGVGHVGIYVGGGRMINAPESGAVVRYDSLTGSGGNSNPRNWTVRRITEGNPT